MTLRNSKLFGLEVNNLFADIRDKDASLEVLNLPPKDLDIIRESSVNVSQTDFVTISGLDVPLYKTVDRLYKDSLQYKVVLDNSSGFDKLLRGNLTVNGRITSNAIRFKFVNGSGPSATIKFGDVSTSRVSSWSSADSPVLDTSPISYGSRVGIQTGGQLQFAGGIGGIRLKTSYTPEQKEFASELPTSKIECNIGGQTVSLFAMKGIPLVFRGFFRDINATIKRTNIGSIRPSWRIEEVRNSSKKTDYANRNSNSISYRGSVGAERFIKYYYNPNNVTSIIIRGAGITNIPESVLPNLTTLELNRNQLSEFPNLAKLTPNLSTLNLEDNPFFLTENSDEEKLNQNIANKIPSSVTSIKLGRCFNGSVEQNIFNGIDFPNLVSFNLQRLRSGNQNAIFTLDNDQNPAQLPNVGDTVTSYDVSRQKFTSFGVTVTGNNQFNCQDLPELKSLTLYNNTGLSNSTFNITSSSIETINIGATRLPIPDLRNKLNLRSFSYSYNRLSGIGASIIVDDGSNDFKLKGCPSLKSFRAYSTYLNGRLPKFEYELLDIIDLRFSRIEGQSGSESISADTFQFIPKIRYLLIDSRYWGVTTPLNADIFAFNTKLYYIWFRTYGKTTGNFPSVAACPELRYIYASSNTFSGSIPNFASNPFIYYVNFQNNIFSGSIPAFADKTNLRYLFLANNRFTSLNKFTNLTRLQYLYVYNNDIEGTIPDFSGCPKLQRIYLYNNEFSSYSSGSFATLTSIRVILLQNNNLNSTEINNIIKDLFDNYESFNRSGVVVNLASNDSPSGEEVIDKLTFLRDIAGWSITTN